MSTLPPEFAIFVVAFEPLFSKSIWPQAQVFHRCHPCYRQTYGDRGVADHGLSTDQHFQNYHRVLNRAVWSSLAAARILLALLVAAFVPSDPIVMGLDDTLERRRGAKIKVKGIYRDPVRSSHSHFVKASVSQWPAPVELNVVSHNPVGETNLGIAVFNDVGTVRTLLQNIQTPA